MRIKSILISIIMVMMPITSYYRLWGTEISLNTITAIIVFGLLLSDGKIRLNKKVILLIPFFVWLLVSTLTNYFVNRYENIATNAILSIILMSLILLIYDYNVSAVQYIRTYETICCLAGVFLVIQFLGYYLFEVKILGKLPGFELLEEYKFLSETFGINIGYTMTSFSGIFSERSHFALYCMPLLCMYLFSVPGVIDKSFLKSIVLSFLMVITFSGNAIVIVAVLWVVYIYDALMKKSMKERYKAIGTILLVGLAFVVLLQNNYFRQTLERLFFDSHTGTVNSDTKAAYRIYRGLDFYRQLPFANKLFGVGYRSMTQFVTQNGIVSKYDVIGNTSYEYLSAWFQTLIYGGVIEFIIYFSFLVKLYKQSCNSVTKEIVFCVALLSVSSSILFDYNWLLYISLALCTSEMRNVFTNEKSNCCLRLQCDRK